MPPRARSKRLKDNPPSYDSQPIKPNEEPKPEKTDPEPLQKDKKPDFTVPAPWPPEPE